ncbi:isopenicillin N synthase family dioxygenase [Roseateles violae]|uniref:2-oxoglutarate-dependent ethylene/succinate-forming enzyme n=1 Tax=Roseateles violae TaxID=3058042 RepID=A0ABT8DRX6_9BURK|nr:2-oxoglutarate and iron-dependent oxygenase domain-containing protein [Pelomonas sp. PFR6]MDN3921087.1 2-oxoglutarate and iron-dependent oxygenase domain-containing protein [Pelomonas sp. PFR6]
MTALSPLEHQLPVIDVAPLVAATPDATALAEVAAQIGAACRAHGFFYVRGHGVPAALVERLDALAREFFAQPEAEKLRLTMSAGGRAWRGYFRTGGELTSGRPDWKEGFYLGSELDAEHALVRAGTPLHGPNLWPERPAGLREAVLDYLQAGTALGHALMRGIALSLALPADYFAARYTADPLILFRLFNYPSRPAPEAVQWGVGEHTDYGLLTLLYQDATGGLQVRTRAGWIEAPPLPGSFVCNIGDMLDRMTRGLYRSTPHRVRLNSSGRDRLSFPLFFDPNFFSRPAAIEGLPAAEDDRASRWDGANVHAFEGSYGDYLLAKVGKVFPELSGTVLSP